MKNLLLGVFLPLVLVIAGVGLLAGLQAPEPERAAMANPNDEGDLLAFLPIAEVEEVRLLSDTLDIDISGTVVPYRELQLAAEVAGRIVSKAPTLRGGNYVEKGQILYRIDPRDYELEVERLSRKRDQELAAIRELQQDIENAEKLLEVADQELALAEADVKRIESMKANFSSAAELDQARRSRLSAMNQKVTLQNQIRAAKTRRSRLELAAKLAETELDKAHLDLERTVIRAPVDGRVVNELVEADSYVQRGTQLLVIEDTEKVEVACNIRMDQMTWILEQPEISRDELVNAVQASRYELPKTPVEVNFRIAGRDSTTFTWDGVLDRFEGVGLDPQSRTVPIRILVDRPSQFRSSAGESLNIAGPPMLVRGMYVDAVVKAKPRTQLMLVPKLSIKPATKSNVIWKFSRNREVLHNTPQAIAAKAAYDQAQRDGSLEKLFPSEMAKHNVNNSKAPVANEQGETRIDPGAWEAGNLVLVKNVRLVTAYWGDSDVEYWVCEVPPGELEPGDRVIVSPLPGVRADGSDSVRVRKGYDARTELAVSGPKNRTHEG